MRAARPGPWRFLLRYRRGWASRLPGRGATLAALLLATTTASGAPAVTVCFDPTVCRSATTADAPRQLILLPTPARLTTGADGKSTWTIPVLGWVYSPISAERSECVGMVARLSRDALRLLATSSPGASPGPATAPPIPGRLTGFFVDNLCNQRVRLRLADPADPTGVATPPRELQPASDDPFCRTLLLMPNEQPASRLLPLSDRGGLFCGKLTLSEQEAQRLSPLGQPLRLQAELTDDGSLSRSPTRATAEAFLIRDVASELSIISDIDDTARISHVVYKPALLKGTFFEPFRPTPGVAELYSRWQKHSPGLTLHFISSSPLPLYKPLRDELMTPYRFPLATYHLKWFRVSESDTIELLAKSPLLTKKRQIAPLLAYYPHRRWAAVGDTGERDPEVYTNLLTDKMLASEHLAGIFIRDVTCDAQGLHHQKFATDSLASSRALASRSAAPCVSTCPALTSGPAGSAASMTYSRPFATL